MKNIELLAPVGDFECLKAAIQNGANAVYLGASSFSARASAKNFDLTQLEKAIEYARLRNVDVHLAINTLIKNEEFNEAIELAKKAYTLGVSAIIVQDYGLASTLLKYLPDLPIHASTQMTIHNLEGALQLEALGFKRAVLARELSINEIEFIRNNCSIELEVFIHGALCISYSGQCLLSSMIGGRSGNRGKCAQACRLPYELIQTTPDHTVCSLDKGYLLSPRDLCGLAYIPQLLALGVTSLKIEGRMKSPEYVATVTRIYRQYIDLALSEKEYSIDETSQRDLLQVFNRGGFSTGHLNADANVDLIFKEKSNNMGIYIGNIANYNQSKGYITVNLNNEVSLGDTITFEQESSKYHISELMIQDKNIETAHDGQIAKLGRMKGNLHVGDKIYKLESKKLTADAKQSYSSESIKTKLYTTITIVENKPITMEVFGPLDLHLCIPSQFIATKAINNPITKERIQTQFSKTGNTPFEFEKITIELQDGLYINISDLNELRRTCLAEVERYILENSKRELLAKVPELTFKETTSKQKKNQISLLLNVLDINSNYSDLAPVDHIYIPLKYFTTNKYANILKSLSNSASLYIYMPKIIQANYRNLFTTNIDKALETYDIKGFVLSNLGTFEMLKKYRENYEWIGNYSLNVFNNRSIEEYTALGLDKVTLSCELNKSNILQICSSSKVNKELIVYGNTTVMTCGYCFLGNSNKCYPDCKSLCKQEKQYFLKDRLGLSFRLLSDNIQTVTTIYNSKTTSIAHEDLPVDSVRIDILDENLLEVNNIIETVRSGKRLDGRDYTNGNFNREI